MSAQASSAEVSADVIEKFSPVDGSHLGNFPITSPADVNLAVKAAREAFPAWRDLSLDQRFAYLDRLRDIVSAEGEAFAKIISDDTGKPLLDSLLTELMAIPLFIDYYKKEAPKTLKRQKLSRQLFFPTKTSYVEHSPMGVIGVISPWNFPFQLSMIPVLSALVAGNTVVLKPSEVTPLTGELMREIFERAGFPKGVVSVVQGDGSTGAALCKADIDKIFFTGSVATGRKVMAAAAEKPIPVELELGGKDAMIVCHDANLERAARAAVWGGFLNCGQMCISVERLFVVDAVYDAFLALVRAEIERMRVGGPDEGSDMGPLTFSAQMGTVVRHLNDARERGATIAMGGRPMEGPGQFFEPTLVLDVTEEMEIYREETFGPVLPVIRVPDEEEALRMANDHQYGLTGSVWTRDVSRGLELASRMESGQCSVNDVVLSVGNPALPFGGVKRSGFGRYHGPEGLYAFMNQKAIMVDRGLLDVEPFWYPYAPKYEAMLGTFRNLMGGKMVRALTNFFEMHKITKRRG
ncbi:aldehyde dehydrogenase family protein [Lujinxingia vulgaris]|uniref:Aldehyde dehydrogenase n=1 Tax=Lujinxingia vulgaris TaxID=2600176 RepID=A0A5C6WZK5_9DELT|nr:aldehyde dehydrogenase family protein [Lujinxingia vulgaris]TXD35016.1 aldehyde dehydrogenase family protein [Lujinxingia vulgaris]